jgi:quinol monooxygenase YgiN
MYILHVHVRVKPDFIDEFIQATVVNAQSSLQEPGCVRFDVIQQDADPTRFELIEIYRDQAGHTAHRESPHYIAWAERVAEMFAETRSRTIYRNIFPHDDAF